MRPNLWVAHSPGQRGRLLIVALTDFRIFSRPDVHLGHSVAGIVVKVRSCADCVALQGDHAMADTAPVVVVVVVVGTADVAVAVGIDTVNTILLLVDSVLQLMEGDPMHAAAPVNCIAVAAAAVDTRTTVMEENEDSHSSWLLVERPLLARPLHYSYLSHAMMEHRGFEPLNADGRGVFLSFVFGRRTRVKER